MTVHPNNIVNDAKAASDKTLEEVFTALEKRANFKLEAGAGAGKTYSLVETLRHILANKSNYLPRRDQRVACLTYTKVARDEIIARTDRDPAIFVATLHGFLWEMIRPHQKALRACIQTSEAWRDYLSENPEISGLKVEYDLGIRGIYEDRITLHHVDIPDFAIELFRNQKFRSLVTDRFPIIFIDEYQDTPAGLAEALLVGHEKDSISPVVGFFGDHWQQIYEGTCGSIDHPSLLSIPKKANFRSDTAIIDFLNKLRPELPQSPRANVGTGTVTIYHSNSWPGKRQGGQWKGQISAEATKDCLEWLQSSSPSSSWAQKAKNPKILMLTHSSIAKEVGYPNLVKVFKSNSSFINKEDPVIEYLVDMLEPAMQAFSDRKYGEVFRLLGDSKPVLNSPKDKKRWVDFFEQAITISDTGNVGALMDHIGSQSLFSLPARVSEREEETHEFFENLEPDTELELPRKLKEHRALRDVSYSEVRALRSYLENATPFSTEHSVKGAEFDSVIVLVGRGWNKYNFDQMIGAHAQGRPDQSKSFLNSRNLFYVSASRAKHNLALLFVQQLSEDSLKVLTNWVGAKNMISIDFNQAGNPIP